VTQASSKTPDLQALDALTGGAFMAQTSGERSARLREWLLTGPSAEQMQAVYRELSTRDKGAAKVLREKLDELKRSHGQDVLASAWADRAAALLAGSRLNIADAMAWQRDAAKAGAPLSREPLASLKTQLTDKVKAVEDLQHHAMVQREAAVLLAQRIEVLSTKHLKEAQAANVGLQADVAQWNQQAQALTHDAAWLSVDMKYPSQLDASRSQLNGVWEAFEGALFQATTALTDAKEPLPLVPVWAEDLRQARGGAHHLGAHQPSAQAVSQAQDSPAVHEEGAPNADNANAAEQRKAAKPIKLKMDPAQRLAQRELATQAVLAVLTSVELEVTEGHGKASASAAASLRQVLKEHGRNLDTALDQRVHEALTAAGELEGWQRWRADQMRMTLVAQAEALFKTVSVKSANKPAKLKLPKLDSSTPQPEHQAEESVDAVAKEASTQPEAQDIPALSEHAQEPGQEAPVQEFVQAEPVQEEAEQAEPVQELVLQAPDVTPAAETEKSTPIAVAAEKIPAMGGRKMQDALRQLREQWKQADQGGLPNHALWKRFDAACNEAYKVVQAWLDKIKSEASEHRAHRLALLEEVKAWGQANANNSDWRAHLRALHQFADRWRMAGHLSEKAFAELQPQWKQVLHDAAQPLEAAQKSSLERRQALIDQAEELGASPVLRVDAVKALQHNWQTEAQSVPLDRRLEQKLWEAFRKPIDEAFNRKTVEREKSSTALNEHDRAVLEASNALKAANATGDAQKIRSAMHALEAALRGQAQASNAQQVANAPAPIVPANAPANVPVSAAAGDAQAAEPSSISSDAEIDASSSEQAPAQELTKEPAPVVAPPKPVRPLVAMRGDDRPGQKKTAPAPMGRGGKMGDRRDSRDARSDGAGFGGRGADRGDRGGDRGAERFDRGPRLGETAFRAQRDALEHAEMALRKLAAQAHGESLTHLMQAWEQRQAEQVPTTQDLGRAVNAATRSAWMQALGKAPAAAVGESILRLEMAAEVPTPAEHLNERRALQLQLLTRRNQPGPEQTWGQDVAAVLAAAHDATTARRLQNALKNLLRR